MDLGTGALESTAGAVRLTQKCAQPRPNFGFATYSLSNKGAERHGEQYGELVELSGGVSGFRLTIPGRV
jgi:hypothetical protein